MMEARRDSTRPAPTPGRISLTALLLVAGLAGAGAAQQAGNPPGEWRYWGGDAGSTRYSPLDQINRDNFGDLAVAWTWRGDNFGPQPDFVLRSTPIYANGRLFTVAGLRRTVAAIDPETGETLWTFREPHTQRWVRSPRQNYGKGLTYSEVDGRGVIYYVSPAFFLYALDPETGRPLENWGTGVPLAGFPESGVVDLLADLGQPYDPDYGLPDEVGSISNSSPPMVVNGVIVVGNAHQTGRFETRTENARGDILAYDAKTGKFMWKFNIIPQPGEFGHETWENDAWRWSGNISSWAPMSADPERGLVFIPTDAPTSDYFGGFRPGNNLFGNSLLALDVRTGRRVWHFQMIHHDIWDWDNPTAPNVLDVTIDGRRVPAIVQTTKQGFAYAFNRETGEPLWPIVERPVPPSPVPGERASPTQPFPTKPAAYEMQGFSEDELVDFTPELRQKALEIMSQYSTGPMFHPPIHRDNAAGKKGAVFCPAAGGGTNILGGTVADPETGIIYVASVKTCSGVVLIPGSEVDDGAIGAEPTEEQRRDPRRRTVTGRTVAQWVHGGTAGFGSVDGVPILKPPYGRITAIDMNTGEHLWWIPNGDTPERLKNHALLQGVELGNTGQASHATALVTRTLLIYGEGRTGEARMHAVDKRTGERLATVELPAATSTAPMTFMHNGQQYIVTAVAGDGLPGSLVALRLP